MLIDELKERKSRGLGDGESLYLKRRYNLQNKGRDAVFTPETKSRMNQTQIVQNFFSTPRDQTATLSPRNVPEKKSPRDQYLDELIVKEDPVAKKIKIPKTWEKDPLTDRNHYMKSPQFRFSMQHGDYDVNRYQSRYMNRRFKQMDSFTKVIPTYHHHRESSYCN